MVKRSSRQVVTTVAVGLFIALTIAILVRLFFQNVLFPDEPVIGWFGGIVGTLYALFAAFVLVAVWNHYNSVSDSLAGEAKTLTSLWNYTDYLNDSKVSYAMQKSLRTYIKSVVTREISCLAQGSRVNLVTQELLGIKKTIDEIVFDDARDESAFKALIATYENLELKRSNRIELSLTRTPIHILWLFGLVSLIFSMSFLLHVFHSPYLYFASVTSLSLIVTFTYGIVLDLDNPFDGLWVVDFSTYDHALDYINSTDHHVA